MEPAISKAEAGWDENCSQKHVAHCRGVNTRYKHQAGPFVLLTLGWSNLLILTKTLIWDKY